MTRRWVAALATAVLLAGCDSTNKTEKTGPDSLVGPTVDDTGAPNVVPPPTEVSVAERPVFNPGPRHTGEELPLPPPRAAAPDGGAVQTQGPGPWPNVPNKNYSADYNIGSVQSVGFDDAHNLWLLSGSKIGVLRPGDSAPRWTSGVGQAGNGRSTGSTVICGGSAGRAYVGYSTYELQNSLLGDVDNPEYQNGDMDVVKLEADGTVSLDTHLQESVVYLGNAQNHLGIRNTNDWRYDEDRTVFVCNRIMKGPNKGDVFIGTNHGVTMIRGTVYNSHRHPVWDVNGSLRIGYSYALGFSFDGSQVLIGNEWKVGILAAPAELRVWDRSDENPWIADTWAAELNDLSEFDFWRGFTQTKNGNYYLASSTYGLWKMYQDNGWKFSKVNGLPTDALGWLQGTEDGSLMIATHGDGLWRMAPDGTLGKVNDVPGNGVEQLVYDPTVSPPMLYVLTNAGLTVLRSY